MIGAACGAVALALIAGIIMSWSRGAWLGLIIALLAVAALRSRRTFLLASTGVLLVLLVLVLFGAGWLPESIQGRVADLSGYLNPPDPSRTEITDENFSVLERLAHWRAGWCMFESAPWLGVGIGNYGVSYARCPQPHWYEPLGHAHNVFINFLAETGVLGFGTFLAFWAGLALYLVRFSRMSGSPWVKATTLGLLGTWSYLTVHSVFDNLFVQHLQLQLALILAALPALARPLSGHEARPALVPVVSGTI